jgi:hypothetical protein
MVCGIHQSDIGTLIQIQVVDCDGTAVDISGATAKQMVFKKPSGTTLTVSADFVNTGTDGLIKYMIADGDFSEVGTYKVQGVVTVGAYIWHSNFESFRVYRNIA